MHNSKYFNEEELSCPHCEWIPEDGIDEELLDVLDEIQRNIDDKVEIVCCIRCIEYNELVGGHFNSYHTHGMACDLAVPKEMDIYEFADLCEDCGAKGIVVDVDEQIVHIDMRGGCHCREEK